MILSIPPVFKSVMPEPAPIFGRSVKPIPTGGGQIIPTYYHWPPESFSPSSITVVLQLFENLVTEI